MSINTMDYKGYSALIEYSAEDECLVGKVVGINDRIAFHGDSIAGVRENFHNVIDNYLNSCKHNGKKPERPRSGKLTLNLPAELHAYVSRQSEVTGCSLNQMVVDAIKAVYVDGPTEVAPAPSNRRTRGRGKRREAAAIK